MQSLSAIFSAPPAGGASALYGQQRTGKSSVLEQVKVRLGEERAVVASLSMGILDRRSMTIDFIEEVLDQWRVQIDSLLPNELAGRLLTRWPQASEIDKSPLKSLRRARQAAIPILRSGGLTAVPFIVIVDEFTYLYEIFRRRGVAASEQNELRDFMRQLKSLLESRIFSALLVGQDTMPTFLEAFPNEFSVMSTARLHYLSQGETQALADDPIRKPDGQSRYSGYALSTIAAYTDGHPFFTQILCDRVLTLVNARKRSEISESDVEEAVETLIDGQEMIEPHKFDCLVSADNTQALIADMAQGRKSWDSSSAQEVLMRIALLSGSQNNPVPIDKLDLNMNQVAALKDLRMRGVLRETEIGVAIRVLLYADYFEEASGVTTRSSLPKKVGSLLRAPANVAVHGTPGSGKSWIADRTHEHLRDEGVRTVRLDLSTVMSGKEVFERLAVDSRDGWQARSTRDAWRQARAELEKRKSLTVIILDQFDRVLQFDDGQEFLLLLRELVHRPESLHCTALIFSRRSLQAIEIKVRGISTLANVCYTEYLGALLPSEVADMAPGVEPLTDEEIEDCLNWSGGHPFLSKYWLMTRPADGSDVAAELERAKVMLRVVGHLGDLTLVNAAAQLVLGPVVSDMFFEKKELELLGVLAAYDQDGKPVGVGLDSLESFQDALRHATWGLDAWGLIGHAEVRLRGVIETVLAGRHGSEWPDLVSRRAPAVKKAYEDAQAKIARDQRAFGRQAPWLSYTYPGDLWAIIHSEWDSFTPVFSTADKAYWRKVLMGLAQYRAPLAHGRPEVLGDAQRAQCRLYADEVIARIDEFEIKPQSQEPDHT